MGIKYNETTKKYDVSYHKRHPKTRMPISAIKTGIKSEAAARRAFTELAIQVEQKLHRQIVPTWEQLVCLWQEDAINRGLTPKTVSDYLYCLKAYTNPKWSDRTVDKISTVEIRDIILTDLKGKSDHHKQACLKYIRCVFHYGVEAGYINRNPTPTMKFRLGDKLKNVLTKEQVERLLNQAKIMECEWYPHWTMAIYTGARNGELYALTWDKVNFEDNVIYFNCSWGRKNGLKCTKTGDDRIVPIAPSLLLVLKELKIKNGGISPYVLPRIAKWEKGDQARELRFFLAGLGMKPVRFHDLRATFATLLLQSGVEPIRVMKAGGWKSLKTMMIYIRMSGIDTKGMMDNFNLHNPYKDDAVVLPFSKSIENGT